MTATLAPNSRQDALTARLHSLRSQRDQVFAEITPEGSGDAVDRATNVDAEIRLGLLEQRIATVEAELRESALPTERPGDGAIAVGDVVTIDFGDGAETFLFGSVDGAGDGLDAITPGSPLGQALLGASVGATVTYRANNRRTMSAEIVAVN